MHRGETGARLDPQYLDLRRQREVRYSRPRYPLTKIGDIAELIQYGISERANTAGSGTPIIRMNNLQPLGWDLSDLKHIDLDDADLKRFGLRKGDILFNRTNSKELVGKSEVFSEDGDWVFASYLIRVRLDHSKAMPEFVSAFLNTEAGRIQIDQVSRQIAGMSNVNAEELRALEIPLPPLATQAAILREYQALTKARDKKLDLAKELLSSIDHSVLAALNINVEHNSRTTFAVKRRAVHGRLDADYASPRFEFLRRAIEQSPFDRVRLGEVVISMRSGFAAGSQAQAREGVEAIPHLRPLNLNGHGELTLEGTKSVPREAVTENDLVARGEVLFNNTNSAEWVGKTAVFDLATDCACSNHITRIVANERVDPYFLAAFMNALRRLGYFGVLSTFFNNQAGISASTLAELPISLPPLSVQRRIGAEAQNRKRESRELRATAASEWEAARQILEKRLLNGETE